MQNPARDTLTFRNRHTETALPMRSSGPFYLARVSVAPASTGTRHLALDRGRPRDTHPLRRSVPQEVHSRRHGRTRLADRVQELSRTYDKFERMAAASGKAGNLRGQTQPGGNPFEAARDAEYPLPALEQGYAAQLLEGAARQAGYHPFPRPVANTSRVHKPGRLEVQRLRLLRSLRAVRVRGQREGQPPHHVYRSRWPAPISSFGPTPG